MTTMGVTGPDHRAIALAAMTLQGGTGLRATGARLTSLAATVGRTADLVPALVLAVVTEAATASTSVGRHRIASAIAWETGARMTEDGLP